MQKIKIICFLFDPNVGGPTIRARAVYERLQQSGHDIRVVFPKGEGSAESYMAAKSITVDRLAIEKPVLPRKLLPFLRFATLSPVALAKTVSYLRLHKPDVVHVNGAFDVIPAVAGKLAGVPVVWHLNDTVFAASFSKKLGKMVMTVADVVVTAADKVKEHYGITHRNTITIHAPVNVDNFPARSVTVEKTGSAQLVLLGNWNWIKGHDRFVEVMQRLIEDGADVKGVVAGKFLDGQRDYWEPIVNNIRASGLTEKIETPGFVADTLKLLQESKVFLLTSHSEASPISVLEAMAVGVPCVVFDVGGVREMLGEGDSAAGIIVPQGNVAAMVEAISLLLEDQSLYRRMSENGQRRARSDFSLDVCVNKHLKAYSLAVASR